MSLSYKTLLIDSTYRNRRKYPSPFNFNINSKYVTSFDKKNMSDPVSEQASIETWVPNNLLQNFTVIHVITQGVVIVKCSSLIELQTNYYKGLKISYTQTSTNNQLYDTIIGTKIRQRITNQNETIMEIYLKHENKPTSEKIENGMVLSIVQSTDFANRFLYIPGNHILDKTKQYYITNNTLGAAFHFVYVQQYNSEFNIAYVQGDDNPNNQINFFDLNHELSLRSEIPIYAGRITDLMKDGDITNMKNTSISELKQEFTIDNKDINKQEVIDNYCYFYYNLPENKNVYPQIDNIYFGVTSFNGDINLSQMKIIFIQNMIKK